MLTSYHLPLEQRRVGEFLRIGMLFRDSVSEVPSEGLKRIAGGTVEALSYFIESEVQIRQSERFGALAARAERVQPLRSQGDRANERGLRICQKVTGSFDALRKETAQLDHRKVQRELEDYRESFRETLAESEIKVSDAQKIDETLTECFQALEQKGVPGLIDRIEKGAKQLDKLRRQQDRGAVGNIPLWKIGGLVILLGVAIIGFIHCGIFGCSIDTRNAYIAAVIITALVTLGC